MVNVKGPRETENSKRGRKRPRENEVIKMTERYSHLSPDHKKDALKALDG